MIKGRIFPSSLSPILLLLKKKFYNLHSYLVCKLTNRKILVVFHPVVEYLGDVVCDVITVYVRVETTSEP
jgi:hypothetical protein